MRYGLVSCLLFTADGGLPWVTCQSGEDLNQVLQDISRVDPRVRPVRNYTTPTPVSVIFYLMTIISLDTVEQKLISNAWLRLRWTNEYTTWDPSQYGGARAVYPDPNTVWRPRITVENTMNDLKPVSEDYVFLLTFYHGDTTWLAAERFETSCTVDVTYFPFDIQTCEWRLDIWGADPRFTHLYPTTSSIDLKHFSANGEWDLRSTRAWRDDDDGYVHYEVRLRRRPSLLALTVLLPVFILALVNVFVFTIPSEAGERLAYSMTALLAFGVFMSFIMDSMPSSTETLSIVAVNLSGLLVLYALYVLLCILSLRLFHRDSSKHPVPDTLQSLIVWLELIVCLDPPNKTAKADVIELQTVMDLTLSDVTGQQTDVAGMDSKVEEKQTKAMRTVNKVMGKLDKWAAARKRNHAAYTNPDEMTWRRVSRTLDKLLFRFFFCLVLVSSLIVWSVLVNYYLNHS